MIGIVLQVNANPVINASSFLRNVEETVMVVGAMPLVEGAPVEEKRYA